LLVLHHVCAVNYNLVACDQHVSDDVLLEIGDDWAV
jgi:hypothetical protein